MAEKCYLNLLSRWQSSGIALEKQLAINDSIGNLGWNVDMSAGTATFGNDLTFPIQI
ncbi:DUF6882 domain-containing protein [Paenibacillus planticolens]|uniref:DUF6882 domain-containing protein n=1 Tax=Paenibacillus planticolens TaxID=2654976 RepID=UPI001492C4B4|nr:DUF6882 domain-containing protein [Paenibacillus planticolens]